MPAAPLLLFAAALAPPADRGPVVVTPGTAAFHRTLLVADGHNDLPWAVRKTFGGDLTRFDLAAGVPELHTDLPRLRAGGVGLQFWSVYVPASTMQSGQAAAQVFEQIGVVRELVRRYPADLALCTTAAEVDAARADGKIAGLIGMEGGHAIENSLTLLRQFREAGAAYMTLTHSDTLDWADAATDDPKSGGLNDFGRQVVAEMNRLGMLVDLSHVSPDTMHDALDVSTAPVIFSHSSARAVADHPRNVPDDVLRRLPQNGGVVMVNFYSGFVVPAAAERRKDMFQVRRDVESEFPGDTTRQEAALLRWRRENPVEAGTVHDVLDHIDHLVRVAGVDHVGLGADYDGVSTLPAGLGDVSGYPRITQGLLDRGHSREDVAKIMGGNTLRVLRAVAP